MTRSEELFERLCRDSHVPCERIPSELGQRTADYRIRLDTIEAVVEVKQMEHTAHERRLLATARGDDAPAILCNVQDRIRAEFHGAKKQLKNSSEGQLPCLLVLYDNTGGLSGLDTEAFLQAMHGNETVEVLTATIDGRPRVVGAHHMFDEHTRKIHKKINTSVSCFCWLLTGREGHPMLYVFHNEFAAHPLCPEAARLIAHRQFIRPEQGRNEYRTWKSV